MHIEPSLWKEPLLIDRRDILLSGSMPENIRGLLLQFHIHRNRVALVRADQRMLLIEGIPLLFIRPDDLLQQVHIKLMSAGSVDSVDQLPHICPAVLIQCDADGTGLVAEDQGK